MVYHRIESVVDQHLTQDTANFQLSRSLVSVGYYVNLETRFSVAHSHPYYEFILVQRGVCEYQAFGERFFLHPDEMLFISPGTVHTMICQEGTESYERLILQTNADFMGAVLEENALDRRRPPLYILRAEDVCRWGLRELVERINATASVTDTALRERLYRCQIGELVLTVEHLAGGAKPEPPSATSATSALIRNVTAYILESFRDPELNVSKLARQFYVSREHLSRTFRDHTGESISHYITDLRMQEFRYGLVMGRSVLDACLASGFSDYSSFVKTFRKLYGITPAEYREQLKNALNRIPAEEDASGSAAENERGQLGL